MTTMFGTVDGYTYGKVIRTEAPHWCKIDVWHSEDWYDLSPPFIDVVSGEPVDFTTFTALAFHLWIRPTAGYTGTPIDHLTLGAGIYLDAQPGCIHFHRVRDVVEDYPLGRWHQWLGMSWTDPDYGAATCKLLWEGPLVVHPSRFVDARPPYTPPANTVAPVVSGTVEIGAVLTTTNGTWTNSPTSYSYQWKRGTTNVGTNANTYTLVSGDLGAMMSCVVTATNSSDSVSASSNSVGPVTAALPVNTVLPVISGDPIVGSSLTTTNGTWTNSPTSYAYQWKKAGVAISGATSNSYVPVSGDIGSTITVTVTASNSGGAGSPATSSAVGPVVAAGGAAALLTGETDGWAVDFTYPVDSQRVAVKTAGSAVSQGLLTFFSQTNTSPKQVYDASGNLIWTAHNMFLNSEAPATQTVTVIVGQTYTVSVVGSGSLVGSSGASGTATEGSPVTFTATGVGATWTKSGTLTRMQMNRGPVATAYLATTAAQKVGIAIDYDPVTHVCKGALLEPSVNNLFLNTATPATQNVTVAAQAHTLSFFGTGTITLSGVSTAGPLVGTGASNRVSLTFTPTAGTLTLTVSGSITQPQLEVGLVATSPFPSGSSVATRGADNVSFLLSAIPAVGSDFSLYGRVAASPGALANSRYAFNLNDGTANKIAGLMASVSALQCRVIDGGTVQAGVSQGTHTALVPQSIAGRVKTNDFAVSVAGAAAAADTTGTVPTGLTTVPLGTAGVAGVASHFYLEKLMIVMPGWNNATLATKSAT